jgi:hypothetical protein
MEIAMKTRHWGPIFAFVTALAFVSAGCKDSNTIAGPPPTPSPTPLTPSPTPTPTPAPDLISGAWEGTFESQWPTAGCSSESPARATFTGVGNQVTGRLEVTGNPCGFRELTFEGTIEMSRYYLQRDLSGRIAGDPFTDGSAQGVLGSESTSYDFVMLHLRNGPTAAGTIWLTRTP